MSEEPTRSELEALLALRRQVAEAEPGMSGFEVAGRLTEQADAALRQLAAPWAGLTLVAVGGYGRGELCLHSDLDLLLLHEGAAPGEAVRAVLYPLWNAGVKVGHATRTARAALTFAREDHHGLCSLLSLRHLSGPTEPSDELLAGLARLLSTRRSAFSERLAAEEREVWQREPFALQSFDLKIGRGGLRSLHRLDWDRRRAELLEIDPDLPVRGDEEAARKSLIDARQALHVVRGQAADTLAVELRPAVANWMRRDPYELTTELYQAARTVDGRAGLRWGQVRPAGSDPVAHAGLAMARLVRSRWSRRQPMTTPLVFALGAAASPSRGRLSWWESEFSAGAEPPVWQAGDRAALVSLLAAGPPGWDAICGLWESGWLPRALPEISHLRGLAEAAPFHQHPADAHLGATVAAAVEVAEDGAGWLGEIVDRLGGLDELLLAAFLHDVGKGLPGDHSATGATLATTMLHRLGFGAATVELVGIAVRQHLLLSDTAARRNIDDPAVLAETARLIGSTELLRLLAVLSVADARATGPDMWNPWKESLLRGLVTRLEPLLAGGSTLESTLGDDLRRALPDVTPAAIERHLETMPPGYLAGFGPEVVARHIRLVNSSPSGADVRMDVVPGAPATTVIVASRDRPALLAAVSGVLTLRNLSVVEARAVTTKEGMALDTFRIVDALGSDMIGAGRWPAVRDLLQQAVQGQLDLSFLLAEKRRTYPSGTAELPSEVRVDDRYIDVRTGDRVGLLHDIAAALSGLGLEIVLAKIDTRAGEAVDVFEVANPEGVSDAVIREHVLAAIR